MYTKRYRVGIDLDRYAKILVYAVLIGMLISAVITASVVALYYEAGLNHTVSKYETQIRAYQTKLAAVQEQSETALATQQQEHEAAIASVEAEVAYWVDQYDQKAEALDLYMNDQEAKFDLVKEYWYVLKDAPKNSGLTLESIAFVDQMCREWDVNPHWMWHIYEIETHYTVYKDNSQGSGARGLGQVMPSTGRMMWEKVLQKGTYDHSMAYDLYTNVEITVALLGRNLAISDMTNAIQLYSGGGGSGYYNAVVNAAKAHGITLSDSNAHYPN